MKRELAGDSMMEGDPSEVDEIIAELPLFLSAPDAGEMYQIQYPTHSQQSLTLDGYIVTARLRPSCKQMELVKTIIRNMVYDDGIGEQLATNADGVHSRTRDAADNAYPNEFMDRSVLRSDGSLENIDNYAVARLVPKLGLTIAPLNAMLPLRPAMDYLDLADRRIKHEKKAEEEAEEGKEQEDMSRAVTVRFERSENERMKNARERSYTHHQRKIQEEPWAKLEYTGIGDEYGEHINRQIFCNVDPEKIQQFRLPPSHFLSLLTQNSESSSAASIAAVATVSTAQHKPVDIPKSIMYAYTIDQQIEMLMRRVGVAQFSDIVEFMEPEPGRTDASLIEKIQKSATLVQGCWVYKSDLLYPSGAPDATVSSSSVMLSSSSSKVVQKRTERGTLHTDMQKAREYALYLFTTRNELSREEIKAKAPVSGEDLLQLLRGIAKPLVEDGGRRNSGLWQFLLPTDQRFIDKFKAVSGRYRMVWDYQFQSRGTSR